MTRSIEEQLLTLGADESDLGQRLIGWQSPQFGGAVRADELLRALDELALAIRLTKPNGRVKDITVMSGDIMQVNRGEDSETFASAYGMWKPEFADYVLADDWASRQFIQYTESGFMESDSFDYDAMGGGDSVTSDS